MTVANVGDSRAVLGYVKEVYPTETHTLERPRPLPFPPAPESAATSPEDVRSFDFSCPQPQPSQPTLKPVLTESETLDPTKEELGPDRTGSNVTTAAPAPPTDRRTRQREFNKAVSVQLSSDHKPDVPDERNRILKSGQSQLSRTIALHFESAESFF